MNTTTRRTLGLLVVGALAACGGHFGDLSGGPRPPVRPPILPPAATPQVGLIAMAAGDGEVRIDYVLPAAGFEAALFLSPTLLAVFQGQPAVEGLSGTSMLLTTTTHPSLVVNGQLLFAGFAIRAVGSTDWTPVGTPIRCHPCQTWGAFPSGGTSGVNIFVDPSAPASGDGWSPTNPIADLSTALLVAATFASALNGANVLLVDATYTTRALDVNGIGGAFPIGPDVHVFGGFQPGFALADRQPTAKHTIMHGGPTTRIMEALNGGATHVLDGLFVDGRDATTEGVDVVESDCELRSVTATRCLDNGMRIKQLVDFGNRRNVAVIACDVSQNGDDGLGLVGVFNVTFDRSTFDANGGAGIDINDLIALEGSSASVTAFGCRFFGNSLEGLGMDLATLATANDTPGGRYLISVDACRFERNGTTGLDIDEDHDLFPAWHTTVRVRDCIARANRLHGIHIDGDDQGDYVVDRVRCTANAGDGFSLTSEPDDPTTTEDDQAPGHVAVTNSYFGGNLGAGMRASQGDKVILASHCALAGNQGGGIVSELTHLTITNPRRISSAVSSIFWRQPTPFTNVVNEACWIEANDVPFSFAPELFAVVTANANGALTLSANSSVVAGQVAVVGDDGKPLAVTSALGSQVVVSPAPTTFVAPDALFVYPDADITDDLRLRLNHPAVGTGLVPAGHAPVDPGPAGSIGGGEPGVFDPFTAPTLHLLTTSPPIATGVTATSPIVLTFDRALDPASVTANTVLLRGGPAIGLSVLDRQLTVSPPVSGWPSAGVMELNIGITAVDGTPFGTPLLIPVLIR